MAESSPKHSFSGLRRVWTAVLGVGFIFAFMAGGARFYMSDARLKGLIETQGSLALGSPLKVGTFQFSIFDGLRLGAIQIGENQEDPLGLSNIEEVRLQWEWPKQSWSHIQISDVSILGLSHSKHGPSEIESPPPVSQDRDETKSKPFVLPRLPTQHWPVKVSIEQIQVTVEQINVRQAGKEAQLAGIQLQGSLMVGDGLAQMKLLLETIPERSLLKLHTAAPLKIEGSPTLKVSLSSAPDETIALTSHVVLPVADQSLEFKHAFIFEVPQGRPEHPDPENAIGPAYPIGCRSTDPQSLHQTAG